MPDSKHQPLAGKAQSVSGKALRRAEKWNDGRVKAQETHVMVAAVSYVFFVVMLISRQAETLPCRAWWGLPLMVSTVSMPVAACLITIYANLRTSFAKQYAMSKLLEKQEGGEKITQANVDLINSLKYTRWWPFARQPDSWTDVEARFKIPYQKDAYRYAVFNFLVPIAMCMAFATVFARANCA